MFKTIQKLFALLTKTKAQREVDEKIDMSINDFLNRPIYKKLTPEIIDSTSDDTLLQTVFDNLSEMFSKDEDEYQTVVGFNKSQQAIYVIWALEAEVNNGGFNQYYANSSGQFSVLTPDALKLIGANKFSDLITKANKIYEDESINEHQDGTVEGFSKSYDNNPLDEFDNDFYEYYKDEDLMQLQVAFIRNNKSDFVKE